MKSILKHVPADSNLHLVVASRFQPSYFETQSTFEQFLNGRRHLRNAVIYQLNHKVRLSPFENMKNRVAAADAKCLVLCLETEHRHSTGEEDNVIC